MPDEVASWVQKFIDDYHVEEPFKKRKNKKATIQARVTLLDVQR